MIDSCNKCLFFRAWDPEGNWGICFYSGKKERVRGDDYCYYFLEKEYNEEREKEAK